MADFASDNNAVLTPMSDAEIEEGLKCGAIDVGQINWLIKRALDKVETDRYFVNASGILNTTLFNGVLTDLRFGQHRDPQNVYDQSTGIITYPVDGFVVQNAAIYFQHDTGENNLPFTSTISDIVSTGSISSAYRLGAYQSNNQGALTTHHHTGSIVRQVKQGDTSKVRMRQVSGETKNPSHPLSFFQSFYLTVD